MTYNTISEQKSSLPFEGLQSKSEKASCACNPMYISMIEIVVRSTAWERGMGQWLQRNEKAQGIGLENNIEN